MLVTLMLLPRQALVAEEVPPVSDDANAAPEEGAPLAPGADPQTPSVEIPDEIDTVLDPGVRPVFYLTDYSRSEPVAEIELATPERHGIQRIDLAEHGIELELEIEYDWAIALVVDAQQRSRDIVANAYIQRVPPPPSISEESCSFETCIELGLWYDALETISDAIDAAPQNPVLRAQRDELLREVGLGAAVDEKAQQPR